MNVLKKMFYPVLLLLLFSCGKSDEGNTPEGPTAGVEPDVYVAGKIKHTPTIWKNAGATQLTDGSYTAKANAVFVNNNDVYAAGFEQKDLIKKATLWKNGNAIDLSKPPPSFTSVATSVAVVDNDVYVAGYEYETGVFVAKVWKNGVSENLSNGSNDAYALDMVVVNNDVYVVGYESFGFNNLVAKLWKNGVGTNLTDGSNDAKAHAATVFNNDVYIVVDEHTQGVKIFKNGTIIELLENAHAYDIAVNDDNIYVVGEKSTSVVGTSELSKTRAVLWKNGEAFDLSEGSAQGDIALSVKLNNDKPYVVGYVVIGTKRVAKVWKEGISRTLFSSEENTYAYDIFLQ